MAAAATLFQGTRREITHVPRASPAALTVRGSTGYSWTRTSCMSAAATSYEGAGGGSGRGARGPGYSGDLSGWSGRQARQGVQPASLAAARVILSRSLSPRKRMRMQWALWYLGTPGTTVTSMVGSGPAGSA